MSAAIRSASLVGPAGSADDLGYDSLLQLRLFDRLRTDYPQLGHIAIVEVLPKIHSVGDVVDFVVERLGAQSSQRDAVTPVELVCFHHAGGGSASFHPLRRALAAMGVEATLTTVKLPGRESRCDEPRYVDADACVRGLADELDDLLSRPHVLLGHSMGALLAYSLAQQRISRGLCAPEAVIVAAYRAPHLRAPMHDLHLGDDHELAAELARYGGLPAEILSRPEWLELLMPIVRDDLRICQSYRSSAQPPLPCPLHVFGGRNDPLAPPDTLAAWSSHSAQPQPVRLFSGDHFLFRRPDPELVVAVARIVDDVALERI